MLSFDTVHAITDHLYLADATHRTNRLTATPTLLLLHESTRCRTPRLIRAVELPLPDTDAERTLADHLQRVADTITALTAASASAAGGWPVLGCAVRYADVTVHDDAVEQVHRVDAVDVDGRLYRLTRRSEGSVPTLLIDDIPDPAGLPDTYRGLSAVLAATTARLTPANRAHQTETNG